MMKVEFHSQIVDLDWWPVSRDCLMYGVAVVSLIGVLYDGIVMWYEGLALVLGYIFYIIGRLELSRGMLYIILNSQFSPSNPCVSYVLQRLHIDSGSLHGIELATQVTCSTIS